MELRMKKSHYTGYSGSDKYVEGLPMPGCLHYDKRMQFHKELGAVNDPARREQCKREFVQRLKGLDHKEMDSKRTVIRIKLSHGDIVVMDSSNLQKYYEVTSPALLLHSYCPTADTHCIA